ncbi:MAG: hypothetical protein OXC02_11255 [Rhodobacteraceae bacterium]|nr:hypothetical protein [Paracoccaceae bacterium]
MNPKTEHEIYVRRRSRNLWVLLGLVTFIVLVFGITIVKFQDGHLLEGFDHTYRNSLIESTE